MAGPLTKKIKTEEDKTRFFNNFLCDKKNHLILNKLRTIALELRAGSSGLSVSFLRVLSANARKAKSFSSAKLEVETVKNHVGCQVITPLSVYFLEGLKTLINFLDETDPKLPESLLKQCALRKLLQLISDKGVKGKTLHISTSTVSVKSHAPEPRGYKKTLSGRPNFLKW